jgi:hypothetical protein
MQRENRDAIRRNIFGQEAPSVRPNQQIPEGVARVAITAEHRVYVSCEYVD